MPSDLINELQKMIGHGGAEVFDVAPRLLGEILKERLWADRLDSDGKPFENFEVFATHRLWQGLESSIDDLRLYCRHHPEIDRMIMEEIQPSSKQPRDEKGRYIRSCNTRTEYGDATNWLARLKRDRPDLAAKVIAGELSANAAAIEAGFRKPPDELKQVQSAWRRATPEKREAIAAWIDEQMSPLKGSRVA